MSKNPKYFETDSIVVVLMPDLRVYWKSLFVKLVEGSHSKHVSSESEHTETSQLSRGDFARALVGLGTEWE
jgi:hypothetical protein